MARQTADGTRSLRPLTPKQQAFVREYLVDLNSTQAAIRAGYSKRTAGSVGHENLTKPEIRSAIDEAMKARAQRTEITADRVLTEVARIAFFDPRRLFTEKGEPKAIAELDDDAAAVVAGLDVREEFEGNGKDRVLVGFFKKWKVCDKVAALTLAMRHLGMLDDRLAISGRPLVTIRDYTGRGDLDSPPAATAPQ